MSQPALDPDEYESDEADELTDALARCYAHLARREHSVAELRSRLERAGLDEPTIEEALAVVVEQGYVSDERYAQLFAEDRRSIDGWGVERIRARLVSAGIDRALIDLTLAEFDGDSERQAAVELLRRRFRAAPDNDRERQRAFAVLIRQGFEAEIAYEAIRQHERETSEAAR